MSPSWYSDIDLWFKKFEFDEEVMIALFQYCFDKSALHKNYVKTVAEAWHSSNIKTFTDLEEYDDNIQKIKKIKKNISKKLGLTRNLTQYEEAYIEKWIQEYKYNLEIIELALKKTTSQLPLSSNAVNLETVMFPFKRAFLTSLPTVSKNAHLVSTSNFDRCRMFPLFS